MTLAFESALELARKIRDREISSRELTDYFINRIERFDDKVNAVVVHDFERAREAADAADMALARGDAVGPVHGLPMTVKEAFDLVNLPTTWGIPEYRDNIATRDADMVAKFKAAGARFIGKTNVPFGLADHQSYNEIYGTTNNPWNVERTPGGSSGGAAAALAAGLTGLESGSDIGGSIRNPAHFCGVYGHKPTWGIIPPQGHGLPGSFASSDMTVVGPLARSADDLAAAIGIVTGPEALNRNGWKLELPRPTKRTLADYRVALWPNDERAPVSVEISDRLQTVGDRLASIGATISDSARPNVDVGSVWRTYLSLLRGVMTGGVSDEEFEELLQVAARFGSDDLSEEAVKARDRVQYHRGWLANHNDRERLRTAWRAFFDEWDILLCPTIQTVAYPHDHSPKDRRTVTVNNQEQPFGKQLFWAGIFSVAYLPSTVFPTGPSSEGLPIGLQAVGAEYDDYVCIDFARLMAEEFGGFTPPDGYDD